jgi:hypothetical protein
MFALCGADPTGGFCLRTLSFEDAGPLDGVLSSARNCSPYFVLLCPSLCLLCAALTRLVGFALEPYAFLAGPCGARFGYGFRVCCRH